jgi:hypothetical protein
MRRLMVQRSREDRNRGSTKFLSRVFVALLPLLLAAAPLRAQGTIAGVVVDRNQAPIPAAQLTVRGTTLGTQTDASGRFRISGATGSTVVIEVRRLGYRMVSQTVSVSAAPVRIVMDATSTTLDAVVVTGQPGSTAKRTLGVDIAQIDASALTNKAPINNVQNLINGRAAGVTILQNSGVIGSGATVRVRGVSSFALSTSR